MKESRNSERVFICPILPESVINKYGASFAANNFCTNLLSKKDIFDRVYVTLPIRKVEEKDLSYSNNRISAAFSRSFRKYSPLCRFAFIPEAWIIFKKIHKNDKVWYYNLAYTLVVVFILLKLFKPSVKQNIILLDYTPSRHGIKGIIESFLLNMINRADGMITLAPNKIFKASRILCLPGVVPAEREDNPKVDTPAMSFLLSGALNETISQTSMVLEAFAQTPQCTLHVTGFSDNAKIIEEYAANYPNIVYHRQLPFKQYLELLHSVTFQLSTRKPDSPENQCNFPSKIIEALVHNRAIVTTIHYPQLDGVKVVECLEPGIEAFKRTLNQLAAMSSEQLSAFVNQGDEVWRRYSPQVWYDTMCEIEESK